MNTEKATNKDAQDEQDEHAMNGEDRVMPWGPYRGKSLGDVADTDDGLVYLDRLLGHAWFVAKFRNLAEAAADICNRRSHELDRLIDD